VPTSFQHHDHLKFSNNNTKGYLLDLVLAPGDQCCVGFLLASCTISLHAHTLKFIVLELIAHLLIYRILPTTFFWTLGSTLPMSFTTWVNPLSWILTPTIVAKTNSCGYWSNENHSPTNGIIAIGLEFETHPTHTREDIVGHWVQCFP
jgi:hypothetical protein